MTTDDTRWGEYVRLQRQLDRSACADDRAAGYEKALHTLLTDMVQTSPVDHEIATRKVRASVERNERRRRVMLRREAGSLQDLERAHADACPVSAVHARIELSRIVRWAKLTELALVVHLAGADGGPATTAISSSAFRKRLERFRERLAA